MKIKYQTTKTLITKPNNNSSDFITPNFLYGCAGNCSSYCYMKRYNQDNLYVNINFDKIFDSINNTFNQLSYPKIENQQGKYWMYDISCNTDIVFHQKHLTIGWNKFVENINKKEPLYKLDKTESGLFEILKWFDKTRNASPTFATKYSNMLKLDVNSLKRKPRVRISLMPQKYSDILEPKMQSISSRIEDINRLKELGWEVHLNYSPVICYPGWIKEYNDLFKEVKEKAGELKSEVIFLTNHANQMANASNEAQNLMKYSSEIKNNTGVMRYPLIYKKGLIKEFKEVYSQYFNLNTIRYIF
jgi:spore photoproduct lyase